MKLFYHKKNGLNKNGTQFSAADYSVLTYDQLLKVNGAKGESGGSGQSGPSSETTYGGNGNNESKNTPSSNKPVDNSNNPVIVKTFTDAGYEQLSDKKDSTYTEGSRKDYMQSEFETFSSDSDSFNVIKKEERFEGVSNGINSYTDYDSYTIITNDGRKVMEAIDVNGDGKIDYSR